MSWDETYVRRLRKVIAAMLPAGVRIASSEHAIMRREDGVTVTLMRNDGDRGASNGGLYFAAVELRREWFSAGYPGGAELIIDVLLEASEKLRDLPKTPGPISVGVDDKEWVTVCTAVDEEKGIFTYETVPRESWVGAVLARFRPDPWSAGREAGPCVLGPLRFYQDRNTYPSSRAVRLAEPRADCALRVEDENGRAIDGPLKADRTYIVTAFDEFPPTRSPDNVCAKAHEELLGRVEDVRRSMPTSLRAECGPSAVAAAPGLAPKHRVRPRQDVVIRCQSEED